MKMKTNEALFFSQNCIFENSIFDSKYSEPQVCNILYAPSIWMLKMLKFSAFNWIPSFFVLPNVLLSHIIKRYTASIAWWYLICLKVTLWTFFYSSEIFFNSFELLIFFKVEILQLFPLTFVHRTLFQKCFMLTLIKDWLQPKFSVTHGSFTVTSCLNISWTDRMLPI